MNASDPFAMLLELFPDVAGEPRRRGRGAKSLAIEQAAARILAEIQPATDRAVGYRIQQYIDTDRWNRAIEVEAVERASMLNFLADWNAMKTEAN